MKKMKHTKKHPGFKKVAAKIARREGVSAKGAAAIVSNIGASL